MWRRTSMVATPPLTGARRAIPAMGSACVSASASEAFGWIKTVAGQDKTKFRGRDRVGWAFTFAAAAYDLVRLPKLMAVSS
ncbi:hypothetical protein QO002_005789 [Pararhizobium capsulatum DSM 1112]|uniref:Transposase DDE domain-containing protein n=1 Tax=Pararhizobium capsulatum DSM 1112 TaxID=1121113 RepID=A0ABU0BZ98_9HYPH|nr:hypothetical protein [Pararhizobium capsulatum DSM 1112]